MAMIIDSHFHLSSMSEKGLSVTLPENFIGLEVAIDGGDMDKRIKLTGKNERIFLSAGAGPWVLERNDFVSIDDEIERIESDISLYSADAIGETGFDNHWKYGTPVLQMELFERQALIARENNIPLIIHSRDADKEIIEEADKGFIDSRTIMHCFSSAWSICSRLLDKGAYISFAGNVTYKSNINIQNAADKVPVDRILVETDSPYLSSADLRGKANNPVNTEIILSFLAKLRGMNMEELKDHIIENFKRVMGSDKSKVKRDITTL